MLGVHNGWWRCSHLCLWIPCTVALPLPFQLQPINWQRLLKKEYPAPFVPEIVGEMDTQHFAEEFTSQKPVDSPAEEPQNYGELFRVSALLAWWQNDDILGPRWGREGGEREERGRREGGEMQHSTHLADDICAHTCACHSSPPFSLCPSCPSLGLLLHCTVHPVWSQPILCSTS